MTNAAIHAFSVGLVIAMSGNSYAGPDARARVLEVCRTMTDDPAAHDRLFVSVTDLGEDGRRALLNLASSKEPEARCALQFLWRLEEERAIPIARKILNDPKASDGMKEEALNAVGAFKDTASFDAVIAIFRSGNTSLLGPAASALGRFGDERGLQALREALSDPRRAGAIFAAVGVKGHEEAIEPLLEFLNKNPAIFERYGAPLSELILSLGRIGTSRSRLQAVALVPRLKDPWSRERVIIDLWVMFESQKAGSHDSAEASEIDGSMGKLKDDSAAPAWIRERWQRDHIIH